NFADTAATKFHVALQFIRTHHLPLDAVFNRADLVQNALADGMRITERLDHFDKFRRQGLVTGNVARLDEHHPLPGLAPLRVIVFVAFEGTNQRPGVALGPQTQIHPKQNAALRRPGHFGAERLRKFAEKLVAGLESLASYRRSAREWRRAGGTP